MRLINADELKKEIHMLYSDDLGINNIIDNTPTIPCFGEWHEIKTKEDLPKKQGYYLVAIERYKNWETKEKRYETNYIFFRGKTTWATCNGSIKAWMELPEEFIK